MIKTILRRFRTAAALMACVFPSLARAQTTGLRAIATPTSIYDDATLLDPGSISTDVYTSFNSTLNGYYLSAPGLDFAVGLTPRFELSDFGGFAILKDQQNRSYSFDENDLGLKILLFPQKRHQPAIAIKPTLDVLNTSGIPASLSPQRASFALPVLVEKDFDDWSISYTGGYITRGLAFSTVKLEGDWWEHLTPVLTVSYSQYTTDLGQLSALGLNRRQTEASAGISKDITSHWSVFADAGRTIGRIDASGSTFECTLGVTFTTSVWSRDKGKNSRHFPFHF